METFKIFVVEDDDWYGEMLRYHLSLNPDYEVERFATGKEFLRNIYRNPSAVTFDYSLPDFTCEELITRVKQYNPDIPVVIVSGQESIATAVELLKKGAFDYIVKDDDAKDRLWNAMNRVREHVNMKTEISSLRDEIGRKYTFEKMIIGNSPAIKRVFALMEKAVRTNITVSITGETGTGKEVAAKAIHYNSPNRQKPFVAINVTAIPKDLIESELFGYEKGAFTGATARRIGKFEQANKGTIFLDEIGEMDINMQTKLLRVLQEKEITRVGGNETVSIDVRVIVATHRNLADEVRKGNFREDLYYRLLGLPIELPPLRERGNDILLLARHFVHDFCKENKMAQKSISNEAQQKLLQYNFPGNVRELKAITELAVVMSNDDKITENDISFKASNPLKDLLNDETTLKEYEKRIIRHFLKKYNDNVQLVADKLDVGKSTIYRMKQNGEL